MKTIATTVAPRPASRAFWRYLTLCYVLWFAVATISWFINSALTRELAARVGVHALALTILFALLAIMLCLAGFVLFTVLVAANTRAFPAGPTPLIVWGVGVGVVCLAGPLSFFAQRPGVVNFLEGFADWSEKNVDVSAIQQWGASAKAESDDLVPESQWPDEIRRLHATSVWKHGNVIRIKLGGGFVQFGVDIPITESESASTSFQYGVMEDYADGPGTGGKHCIRVSRSLTAWVD